MKNWFIFVLLRVFEPSHLTAYHHSFLTSQSHSAVTRSNLCWVAWLLLHTHGPIFLYSLFFSLTDLSLSLTFSSLPYLFFSLIWVGVQELEFFSSSCICFWNNVFFVRLCLSSLVSITTVSNPITTAVCNPIDNGERKLSMLLYNYSPQRQCQLTCLRIIQCSVSMQLCLCMFGNSLRIVRLFLIHSRYLLLCQKQASIFVISDF